MRRGAAPTCPRPGGGGAARRAPRRSCRRAGATKIVSSPAIVPATSGSAASSIAFASGVGACRAASRPRDAGRRLRARRPSGAARRSARRAGRGRPRPAARRRAGRSSSRTFTSPSCAMSRETVACTASRPSSRSASATLGLRRELPLADEAQDRALPLELVVTPAPPRAASSACVDLVAGDRQRRRQAQDGLAGRADEQARARARPRRPGRPGGRARAPSSRPRAAHLDHAGKRASPARARAVRADVREQRRRRSSSTTAHGRGARRPGCRRRSSRGRRARSRSGAAVGDEQRADRQAVREPLRERDRVGPDAELLEGEEAARCGRRRVCTSSKTSIAPCSSASARARCEELRRRAGGRRPRPGSARAGSRRCRARRPRRATRRRSAARSARPATSGSNGARFAGWPVTESAPIVRPWNEPSSATTPGFAGRLARPLERRLDRLGAGVAEERLRAAEAVGEPLGEALPSARSSRGSRRARAGRAARARRRAAPDGSGRARRRRSRRAGRGSACRRRRSARRPRRATKVTSCARVGRAGAPRVGQRRAHATTAVAPIVGVRRRAARAATAALSFGTIPPSSVAGRRAGARPRRRRIDDDDRAVEQQARARR